MIVELPIYHRSKGVRLDRTVIVDPEDADLVVGKYWTYDKDGYFVRKIARTNRRVLLHRLILERKVGRALLRTERTDHVNRIRTDNRRENLRIVNAQQNAANMIRRTSGYKGVARHPQRRRVAWVASIFFNYAPIYIGIYDTPQEAAWMYDQYALQLFQEYARTNFEYRPVERNDHGSQAARRK